MSKEQKTSLSNLALDSVQNKEEYYMHSIRFSDKVHIDNFKELSALLKSRGLKSNQDVFAYMIKCTKYVLSELNKGR